MRASAGDRIVVVSNRVDQPPRDGRILEVRNADGSPPYLVEWSDNGHHGLFYPGGDAHIQHFAADENAPEAAVAERAGQVRTWHVELTMFDLDGETTAHAMLVGQAPELDSLGSAHRHSGDADVPEIGDEVAAARALRLLANRLLGQASEDIYAAQGHLVELRS
jgi:hypothetical protein